jgi:hypothetical protein
VRSSSVQEGEGFDDLTSLCGRGENPHMSHEAYVNFLVLEDEESGDVALLMREWTNTRAF